ncbi:MAG: MmgE/PrpD family protein [Chloroflexi bacterium]|nr:MmgE/PrpD family protein [Chloroflexota bacterium]
MDNRDAIFHLASNVVNTTYQDLPREVIEITKKSILDTVGVILAASGIGEGCQQIVELVKEDGGREESSILGFGGKVPACAAAFANGAMSHAVDYDDVIDLGDYHATAPTLPAAIAITERVGGISGKEFITAAALGVDVMGRLALGAKMPTKVERPNWHPSPVLGAFGSAAGAGKLLGLDTSKMVDAFGHALHQASGTRQIGSSPGSPMRGLCNAFGARAGVLSATLAQRGITGTKDSLESKYGFFNVYFNGDYDRDALVEDLGKRFEGINISFKAWPCARHTHPFVDATLSIVREHDVRPDDVVEIVASYGKLSQGFSQPLEALKKPKSMMDAKLSSPFTIAVAAAKRRAILCDFTEEGRNDTKTLELADKVVPRLDPQLLEGPVMLGVVKIRTRTGAVFSKRVEHPYGHPANPIPMQDLVEKFRDCASYSAKPLPKENIDKAIDLVTNLEEVADARTVIQLLS